MIVAAELKRQDSDLLKMWTVLGLGESAQGTSYIILTLYAPQLQLLMCIFAGAELNQVVATNKINYHRIHKLN